MSSPHQQGPGAMGEGMEFLKLPVLNCLLMTSPQAVGVGREQRDEPGNFQQRWGLRCVCVFRAFLDQVGNGAGAQGYGVCSQHKQLWFLTSVVVTVKAAGTIRPLDWRGRGWFMSRESR